MSKKTNAEHVQEIMQKRFEKRKEEMVVEAQKELEEKLNNIVYTVVTDPNKKGNNFLIAKLRFSLNNMKAFVEDYTSLDQKVIGMKYPIEQDNLRFYFDQAKNMRRKK